MPVSRRNFLAGSSAVAVGLGLPGVFRSAQLAAAGQKADNEKILVVIELAGGNDGLNTVVPFRDDAYAAARPTLKLRTSQLHKLTDDLGLHPALKGLSDQFENDALAVVQGVGYPRPDRSHFESMDIWHRASRDTTEKFGWIGRALPQLGGTHAAVNIGRGESPLALFSSTGHAASLASLEDYRLKVGRDSSAAGRRDIIERWANEERASESSNEMLALVRKTAKTTYESARQIEKVNERSKGSNGYPDTGLGRRLQLVAQLIASGLPEKVYYTSLGGFDTHAVQLPTHQNLMAELGDAMAAFQKDLQQHGHADRVLTMTFSEFGRRVKENGSDGTDHGAASQMFLMGPNVAPGIHGKHPSLRDLDDGDLKHHTDFRQVYATVLSHWLGLPAKSILREDFKTLPILKEQKQPRTK